MGTLVLPFLSQSRRVPDTVPPKLLGSAGRCSTGGVAPRRLRSGSSALSTNGRDTPVVVSPPESVLLLSRVIRSRSRVTSPLLVTTLGRYSDTVRVGRSSGSPSSGNAPGIDGIMPPT